MPDVYATAHGPLARIAAPLAARARSRRHARFFALTRLPAGARVLDVGCGSIGLRALEPALDITGVDLSDRPGYPVHRFIIVITDPDADHKIRRNARLASDHRLGLTYRKRRHHAGARTHAVASLRRRRGGYRRACCALVGA